MFLIVGLGNPGKQYENTRHNVGFDAIDCLVDEYRIPSSGKQHKAMFGKGIIEGQKVILAKPMTYMNLSGEAVRALVDYYKIDPETELLVIFDDISLEPSVGTCNGLAWTSVGGELLKVEVLAFKGKGNLTLTGQLGDVIKESAQAGYTYIRSRAKALGL